MKPRLRKIAGIWHCAAPWLHMSDCMGIGYSPAAAYAEWERLTAEAWRKTRATWVWAA